MRSQAVFTASARGVAPAQSHWQVQLPGESSWIDAESALPYQVVSTSGTLTLSTVTLQQDGLRVRLRARSAPGSVLTSNPARLTVVPEPTSITWQDLPIDYGYTLNTLSFHPQLELVPARDRYSLTISSEDPDMRVLPVGRHRLTATYSATGLGHATTQLTFWVTVRPVQVELVPYRLKATAGSAWNTPLLLVAGALQQTFGTEWRVPPRVLTEATRSSPPGDYRVWVEGGEDENYQVRRRHEQVITLLPEEQPVRLFEHYGNTVDFIETGSTLVQLTDDDRKYHPFPNRAGFRYNGIGSRIHVAASTSYASPAFSLEAWILPLGLGTADAMGRVPILWRGAPSPSGLSWSPASGKVTFDVWTSAGRRSLTSPGRLTVGMLAHVASTYTATTGTAVLYINGSKVAEASGWGAPQETSVPLFIGGFDSPSSRAFFQGEIYAPVLFGRALHAVEVRQYAKSGIDSTSVPFLGGLTHIGGYWRSLPWFGRFYAGPESPWIYHQQHGWIYARLHEASLLNPAFYYFDHKAAAAGHFDWAYASEKHYPWVYVRIPNGEQHWWRFDVSSKPGQRRFTNHLGQWVLMQ